MTNIRKHIGQRIRQIRASQRLTQAEMAKQLNVSPATVSGWEIGDYGISLESAINVSKLSDVSLDWLVNGQEAPPDHLTDPVYTPEEQRLCAAFNKLGKTSQAAILRITEMLQK